MKAETCAYCCGDLVKVEGLLGQEFFCPACRRFQRRAEPRFALRNATEPGEPPCSKDAERAPRRGQKPTP